MSAAAGWYPDNQNPNLERWWDGTAWTAHTRTPGGVGEAAGGTASPVSGAQTGVTTAPAGWYPDPEHGTQQRWWDGTAWTAHTQPTPGGADGAAWGGGAEHVERGGATGWGASSENGAWGGEELGGGAARGGGARSWESEAHTEVGAAGRPQWGGSVAEAGAVAPVASVPVKRDRSGGAGGRNGGVGAVAAKLAENSRLVVAIGAGFAVIVAAFSFATGGGEKEGPVAETPAGAATLTEACAAGEAEYTRIQAELEAAPGVSVAEAMAATEKRLVEANEEIAVVLTRVGIELGGEAGAEAAAWLAANDARRALVAAYRDAMVESYGAETAITDEMGRTMSESAEARALAEQSAAVDTVGTGKLQEALRGTPGCGWVAESL